MNIATVLLLEEERPNYRIVDSFMVAVLPDDSCLPGMFRPIGGCCVIRNLTVELTTRDLTSGYLYAVVDISDAPDMIQTFDSVGYGYDFNSRDIMISGQMITRNQLQDERDQPVRRFQFIIGESRINF